jgi:hypothetical protein
MFEKNLAAYRNAAFESDQMQLRFQRFSATYRRRWTFRRRWAAPATVL